MLLCRLEPSRHRMAHLSLAAPGPGYPSIMPLLRGDIWILDVSLCTAAAHASACRALTSLALRIPLYWVSHQAV